MIRFEHVTKRYEDKDALSDLNLEIRDGEIFGLIGHNGAGKTTTISILTSIIEASYGEVYVDDMALSQHRDAIKKKIAYVPDSPDLFLNLTANDYWYFLTRIYDLEASQVEERLTNLMATFDLTESRYNLISSFSHGMRQKIIIMGALINDPEVWILDEPMTGLDPQSSFHLKQMMREHANKGKTVFFSTHVLEVAEKLCDKIAIIAHGKMIYYGTLEELRAQHGEQSLEELFLEVTEHA